MSMLTVMLSFYYPNFKNDLLNIKSHSYTSIHKAMCQEKIKRHKKFAAKVVCPNAHFQWNTFCGQKVNDCSIVIHKLKNCITCKNIIKFKYKFWKYKLGIEKDKKSINCNSTISIGEERWYILKYERQIEE